MAFKENSRLNTTNVSRSGGSSGGKGVAVGGGIGGVVLLLLVGAFFGQDGVNMLNQLNSGYSYNNVDDSAVDTTLVDECKTGADANSNSDCNMVATSNSLDNFWGGYLLPATGISYSPPKLQLFSGRTSSGCGVATSAVGPFYCPTDKTAYVDTSFFSTMKTQLGATGGQSAEQYVLAHEYGHHIQQQLGYLRYSQYDPKGADSGAVRVELQADCYAGIWTKRASEDITSSVQVLPMTDDEIKRIINATEVIGDDHIQMTSSGHTDSSTYTHGTSAQRTAWFMQGYNTGNIDQCDTFQAKNLNQPSA